MVFLSVLVLIFVVGHQISNANPPQGIDFSIGSIIAEKHFGAVRKGLARDGTQLTIKVVPENGNNNNILYKEYNTLMSLYESQQEPVYLPKVLGYGKIEMAPGSYYIPLGEDKLSPPFEAMAMEMLGHSLSDIQDVTQFGIYTILHLAIKLFTAVKGIHAGGYVLRDWNPANMTIRPENIKEIVISDFGFAVEAAETTNYSIGNYNFMSLNAHHKEVVGKLQDLESLFYVLIKFAVGSLPWTKYIHAPYFISVLKQTLFRKVSRQVLYHPMESGLVEHFGLKETAIPEIDALYELIKTQHPALHAYAVMLTDIMLKPRDITVDDHNKFLNMFKLAMDKFQGDKELDWVLPAYENVNHNIKRLFLLENGENVYVFLNEGLNEKKFTSIAENRSRGIAFKQNPAFCLEGVDMNYGVQPLENADPASSP